MLERGRSDMHSLQRPSSNTNLVGFPRKIAEKTGSRSSGSRELRRSLTSMWLSAERLQVTPASICLGSSVRVNQLPDSEWSAPL